MLIGVYFLCCYPVSNKLQSAAWFKFWIKEIVYLKNFHCFVSFHVERLSVDTSKTRSYSWSVCCKALLDWQPFQCRKNIADRTTWSACELEWTFGVNCRSRCVCFVSTQAMILSFFVLIRTTAQNILLLLLAST